MTKPSLAHFALLTALLPFVCVHLSYLMAASAGHVPWCLPYWDSCTSISATGRQVPEKILFKLLMMPAAVLAGMFWWLAQQWLLLRTRSGAASVPVTGGTAALFLLLYVAALGESNDYRWARQAGIILFFSLSYVAQLLFLLRAWQAHAVLGATERDTLIWQKRGAVLVLLIGVGSVLLDLLHPGYDNMEDAVEWVLMLCITLQFASHYFLWRDAGLRLYVTST